jgi:acetyl-CoA acyltransferase
MEAIIGASRALTVGDAAIAVAGGVESMSRAPWILPKPDRALPTGHEQLWSSTLGWRMVNPAMPAAWTVTLGEGAEVLADEFSIGRDEQDEFALGSHQRAHEAWEAHAFDAEITPVDGNHLARDESIRADTTLERLAKLAPVFRPTGTVTAGNASPMNDGAAMLLLMSPDGVARTGASPLARIVAAATSGVEPHRYGIGPVAAARTALQRAGLTWDDISSVELNEAFAAQALAVLRDLGVPDDASDVNPNGGAIAIGHPLGASGARLVTTALNQLERIKGRYGLCTMCIGVGQGIALVIERI